MHSESVLKNSRLGARNVHNKSVLEHFRLAAKNVFINPTAPVVYHSTPLAIGSQNIIYFGFLFHAKFTFRPSHINLKNQPIEVIL